MSEKPLFIPLKAEFFDAFAGGFKNTEYRMFGPRWNANTCRKPCILAGSRIGDTVLDPFGGSGTTGQVALELGRKAILCELNDDYLPMINQRTTTTMGFL